MSFAVSQVVNDYLTTIDEDTISKISDTVTNDLMEQIRESFEGEDVCKFRDDECHSDSEE